MLGLTGRTASISVYDSPIDLAPPFRLRHRLEAGANRRGAAAIDTSGDKFVDLN